MSIKPITSYEDIEDTPMGNPIVLESLYLNKVPPTKLEGDPQHAAYVAYCKQRDAGVTALDLLVKYNG